MRQFPKRSQSSLRRSGIVRERALSLQSYLFHSFLLRRSNPFQATRKVIWDLDRHRNHSLNTRGVLHWQSAGLFYRRHRAPAVKVPNSDE
jgi:hypothetical protein